MSQLAITNVIDISVSEAQAGIGEYNTSNLGLFTTEIPGEGFGDTGFKQYIDPADVATDFGTNSVTYKMALSVFSQQPNILAGGGQLVVMHLTSAVQSIALSAVPASGTFAITLPGGHTEAINWNDTAEQIQAKIQAVPGGEGIAVSGSLASQSLLLIMGGFYGANPAVFSAYSNTLEDSGSSPITLTFSIQSQGDSLASGITIYSSLVQFFGILVTATCADLGETDLLAAAAVIQPLNKIGFFVTYTEADIQSGGMVDKLTTGGFTQSRGLYYGDDDGSNALVMASAYAGRALSVNFSGSNTTLTMNLKDLSGVQPDPSMTQTIYNEAKAAGADIYASIQGVPKVVSFGANKFFDQVYNLRWFVGALQVAGFNFLAEASTKIPQTEAGMDGLKGAYRVVCEQAVTNQYSAPGSWTSPTTFGNQADLLANVLQRGYYIYSQPVSQQLQADRAARKAPLVQIALKEAGAIQQSSVIVNINA